MCQMQEEINPYLYSSYVQQGLSLAVPLHNCRASRAGMPDRYSLSVGRLSTTTGLGWRTVSWLCSGSYGANHRCRSRDNWRHLTHQFSSPACRSPWSFWCGLQGSSFLLYPGSYQGWLWGTNTGLVFGLISRVEVTGSWYVFLDDTYWLALTGWVLVAHFRGAASWEALTSVGGDFVVLPLWHFRLRFVRGDCRAHKGNPFTQPLCPLSKGLFLSYNLLSHAPLLIYSLNSLPLHLLFDLFSCDCCCASDLASTLSFSFPAFVSTVVSLRRRRARVLGGEIKNWQVVLLSCNGIWWWCTGFSKRPTLSYCDVWRLLHHAANLAATRAEPNLEILLFLEHMALRLCLNIWVCNKNKIRIWDGHRLESA